VSATEPLLVGMIYLDPTVPATERLTIPGPDGELLFALHADGSVTCPDEARIPEAARAFWREVRRLAGMDPATPFPDQET
jgi:hypothetical protein